MQTIKAPRPGGFDHNDNELFNFKRPVLSQVVIGPIPLKLLSKELTLCSAVSQKPSTADTDW